MTPPAAVPPLLAALAGPSIWAAGFSALYGLQALVCANGWPARSLLLGLWLLVLLALLALLGWQWRRSTAVSGGRFLRVLALALSMTGAVAMIWTGMPIIATSLCR